MSIENEARDHTLATGHKTVFQSKKWWECRGCPAGREVSMPKMRCEDCGKPGGYHHTLKCVICTSCLGKLSARDAAFDARCDEDPGFEDWAAQGGDL